MSDHTMSDHTGNRASSRPNLGLSGVSNFNGGVMIRDGPTMGCCPNRGQGDSKLQPILALNHVVKFMAPSQAPKNL